MQLKTTASAIKNHTSLTTRRLSWYQIKTLVVFFLNGSPSKQLSMFSSYLHICPFLRRYALMRTLHAVFGYFILYLKVIFNKIFRNFLYIYIYFFLTPTLGLIIYVLLEPKHFLLLLFLTIKELNRKKNTQNMAIGIW